MNVISIIIILLVIIAYNTSSKSMQSTVTFACGIFFIFGSILFVDKILTVMDQKNASIKAEIDKQSNKFVDNEDGTVTSKEDGLTWQKCSVGQVWTGEICSGEAKQMTWEEAMNLSNDLVRLPTKEELMTLVYCSDGEHGYNSECINVVTKPAINSKYFPNTQENYWSSSTDIDYLSNNLGAWIVSFIDGKPSINSIKFGYRKMTFYVRLLVLKNLKENTDKFVDNKDGTVIFKSNGLTWQRCSVGQQWIDETCSGEAKEMTWGEAKKLSSSFAGHSDWRLPTKEELMTLVFCSNNIYKEDGSCDEIYNDRFNLTISSPTINNIYFPNTSVQSESSYWSSSPSASDTREAWLVLFEYGETLTGPKSFTNFVRLVR